jgi:hypothetical protein
VSTTNLNMVERLAPGLTVAKFLAWTRSARAEVVQLLWPVLWWRVHGLPRPPQEMILAPVPELDLSAQAGRLETLGFTARAARMLTEVAKTNKRRPPVSSRAGGMYNRRVGLHRLPPRRIGGDS